MGFINLTQIRKQGQTASQVKSNNHAQRKEALEKAKAGSIFNSNNKATLNPRESYEIQRQQTNDYYDKQLNALEKESDILNIMNEVQNENNKNISDQFKFFK